MKVRLIKNVFCAVVLLTISLSIQAQQQLDTKKEKLLNEILNGYESLGFSGNVLVGKGDDILFERSMGTANHAYNVPNTPDTKFRLASVSKQFTAAALMVLEQQGKVDFQKPISNYLPALNPQIGQKVTIHHLLSHSSGLSRDIESLSSKKFGKDFIPLSEIIDLINGSTLGFEPGKKWAYSNLGYALGAAIIESATGMKFGDAMGHLLFKPLGMKDTGHETSSVVIKNMAKGYVSLPDGVINAAYEDKSYVIGAGSVYSTARDMFRWGSALMKGELIKPENRDRMFSRQQGRYGYGWYIDTYVWEPVNDDNQATNPHHDGGSPGFESNYSLLTKHETVVVILSNQLPSGMSGLSNRVTNVTLGFEEAPPQPNGAKEMYATLFDKGISETRKLLAGWNGSGQRALIPRPGDVLLVARGYIDAREFDKAILVLDLLIQVRSKWSFPYLFKGIVMEELGRPEKAMSLYEKVLEVSPGQSNAVNRLRLLRQGK